MEHTLRPRARDLVGLTCLACGADQVFADVVLALGGEVRIVVPAEDYFSGIRDAEDRRRCAEFVRRATSTVTLTHNPRP